MTDSAHLDDDLESLDIGFIAKAALAFCALSAASSFFTFLQLFLLVRFSGLARYAPFVFAVLSLVTLFLAAKAWSGRAKAALALLGTMTVLFVFAIAWVVYGWMIGFFAPLPILTAALATLGTAVLAVSQKSFRTVDAAKKRLAAEGMTVGF